MAAKGACSASKSGHKTKPPALPCMRTRVNKSPGFEGFYLFELKVSNGSVVSQHSAASSSSQQPSVTHVLAEDQGTKKRKRSRGSKGQKSGFNLPNPGDSGRSKAKSQVRDHSIMGEDSWFKCDSWISGSSAHPLDFVD